MVRYILVQLGITSLQIVAFKAVVLNSGGGAGSILVMSPLAPSDE